MLQAVFSNVGSRDPQYPEELVDIVLGPYESLTLPPVDGESPLVGIPAKGGQDKFEIIRERAGWAITVAGKTQHRASFTIRTIE